MNIELEMSAFIKLWHCFYVHYLMTLPCLDYVSMEHGEMMRGENWCDPIQCQFFVTDHTRTGLGLNLDLCGERPKADCLSHGTVLMWLRTEFKGWKNWHRTTQTVSPEIFSINSAFLLCTLQGFVF